MNYRPGLIIVLFAVLTAVTLGVVVPSHPVQAQAETPVPTITPTPADSYRIQLSSGAELVVERRITYGEIAVVCVMGLALVGAVLYGVIRLVRLWLT